MWGIIHPLVLLASYTYIFVYCLKSGGKNYPLVLFAGMLPWLLFSETVTRSSGSLVDHSNLITKTMFPSEILPVSIFLSSLLSHLITVTLFAVVAAFFVGHLSPMLVLLPVFTLVLGLFAVGLGWIAAALQVYLRDTSQVVAVVMTFWMWLTPIFITEDKIPAWAKFILWVNPLVYVVRAYRQMLLEQTTPSLHDMGWFALFGATSFICGGLFFRSLKRGFADVL